MFEQNEPIIHARRTGDSSDPFPSLSDVLTLDQNGKAILTEIPDEFSRVVVTGLSKTWSEIQSGLPNDSQYLVDYKNKIVTFNISNAGKQLSFSYKGTGLTYVSTSMIYTQSTDGEITETLKDLTDRLSNLDVSTLDSKIGNLSGLTTSDKSSLVGAINSNTSSLAENMLQTKNVQHSKRRPLVSFVSDDGLSADISILKPIFVSHNVPCVTALITSQLNNVADRLDLQNNHGWEIASHTVNHVYLAQQTDTNLDYELKQSKADLENAGFKVNSIVYPFGDHNEAVRRVSKKYYRLGAEMGHYPVNKGVIPSFAIARTAIGSIYDVIGGVDQNTLEYYKSKVDEAVANNGWCVFMLHPGNTGFNATQQNYLTQVIEYVQSLNIDIVTLRDGWEVFGNSLEVGDYTLNNTDGFAFSKTGEIGNNIPKLIKNTGLNNASVVTAFPANCVSMTTFLNADNGGFPTSAGTLITARLNSNDDLSYQEWYPYDDTLKYKRICSNKVWQPWTIQNGYKVIANTGFNNASLISAFPKLRVTVTTFLNADNGGFPTSAGTLVTSRINSNDFLAYQLWMPYDSNMVYKRIWTGTWGVWELIAGAKTSWVGTVSTSTNWNRVGTFTVANYINFVTWYSSGGSQPTLSKNTWALSEISADSANPTVIGTIGAINIQAYKDANGGIYVKYSTVGNNYSSFFNVAFC